MLHTSHLLTTSLLLPPTHLLSLVELQAVSLVVLSFFRAAAAATALADLVAAHGGILGAAVCCAERGGDPADDWTTCEADRDQLLDRWVGCLPPMFAAA